MTSAVILAGGLGTRLRSVITELPKPMAPINGKPFLHYLMHYWVRQGVNHFVFSVGYRYQAIVDFFGTQFDGVSIEYVIEETPLGTGGGLLLASKKLREQECFLLLNGDTYFEVDLNILMKCFKENNADWCFSLFKTNEDGRYLGVDVSSDGRIISLNVNSSSMRSFANGGVYLINPHALNAFSFLNKEKVSLEQDIFPTAMALDQRFFGKEYKGNFIDIGVPDDYYRASTLLFK